MANTLCHIYHTGVFYGSQTTKTHETIPLDKRKRQGATAVFSTIAGENHCTSYEAHTGRASSKGILTWFVVRSSAVIRHDFY
jgi:hypothetical protein